MDQWDVSEPPYGFFDGLNADDDAELELVHCDVDIVRRYYDHSDGTVVCSQEYSLMIASSAKIQICIPKPAMAASNGERWPLRAACP